jgi:hypothetical protein
MIVNYPLYSSHDMKRIGALSIGDIDVSTVVTCIIGQQQRTSDALSIRSGVAASATIDSTRNRALVLLSSLASMSPLAVVEHLVPVFTHLATLNSLAAGGSVRSVGGISGIAAAAVVSTDDTYTDSLIQQTIETVLPSVASSMASNMSGVADLLRSFIFAPVITGGKDAITTFAALDARRLRLITSLVATLSTSSNPTSDSIAAHLHGAIELLLAQGVVRASQQTSKSALAADHAADIEAALAASGKKKKNKKKLLAVVSSTNGGQVNEMSSLEFCHQLAAAFTPLQQIHALVALLTVFDGNTSTSGESKREKKTKDTTSPGASYLASDTLSSHRSRWEWQCSALSYVGAHLTQVPLLRKLLDLEPAEEATVRPTIISYQFMT